MTMGSMTDPPRGDVPQGADEVLQIAEPVLEQIGKSGGAVPEQRKSVRLVSVGQEVAGGLT